MSDMTLVLFHGNPGHWLRIESDAVVARGERPSPAGDDGERVVAIVPAADTIVHSLALPDLTDAQARSAARIAIAETSMTPVESLHIAVGPEHDGVRMAVVINTARMTAHIAALADAGFNPDALVPAALVLPAPAEDYVRGELGDETVVRGQDTGFADDPALTPLIAPHGSVALARNTVDAAIIAAAQIPPVDLYQGAFQRRRRWAGDSTHMRRIAWLAAACVATLLLVPVATLLNMRTTISQVEARTLAIAEGALPPGTAVTNPIAQLDARLTETGAGPRGFLTLATAAAKAVEASPTADVASMTFDESGGLHVTVRSANAADLSQVETRLSTAGYDVQPGQTMVAAGKSVRDLTVRGR